jgi:hypothetical protein
VQSDQRRRGGGAVDVLDADDGRARVLRAMNE